MRKTFIATNCEFLNLLLTNACALCAKYFILTFCKFKTSEFNWLPYDSLSLKLINARFLRHQQPIETVNLKSFISQDLKDFRTVLLNANNYHNYFEFSNQNCLRFSNNVQTSTELKIFCLNEQSMDKVLVSVENVHQIQSLGQNHICLLTNSSVLIYDVTSSSTLLQRIPVTRPNQMTLGSFKDLNFLAISSRGKSNGLNHGFIEIYRSVNSSPFKFLQTIKCFEPSNLMFSFIEKSNDILLHILTGSNSKPYIIHQYLGTMGFREVLSDSLLSSKFVDFNLLNLYASKQHLVALKSLEDMTFVELYLNPI